METFPMPSKSKKDTNTQELQKTIFPISVIGGPRLKPFIELFQHQPENVLLQPLGVLMGFFKISDITDDSAYIVNFLTSVLKKEYYINYKRSVPESLDSALHKVNLALAEIAKGGNIDWLGKLDSSICVLENNTLHFSVSGSAKVLLLRKEAITDISEGLSPDEPEPNPLKTFVNVSSGELEDGDKIIITSDDLFKVFSMAEIKKGALRFSKEKFAQFFKTALTNELSMSSTVIIDVSLPTKEERKAEKRVVTKKKELNAFSEASFKKSEKKKESEENISSKKDDYTDEKTGHIYIQGDYDNPEESSKYRLAWFIVKEKIIDFYYWFTNIIKKFFSNIGRELKKAKDNFHEKRRRSKIEKDSPKDSEYLPDLAEDEFSENISQKIEEPKKIGGFWSSFRGKTSDLFRKIKFSSLSQLVPNFSRIKNAFKSFTYQQKLFSILAILVIIVAPILFLKLSERPKEDQLQELPDSRTEEEEVFEDKNLIQISNVENIFSSNNINWIKLLGEKTFIIANDKIIDIRSSSESDEFEIPLNGSSVKFVSTLEDLNLILILLENNRLISFSPVSRDFSENTLPLPGGSNISGIATYLTYFYAVDRERNQIYRFPRAEGGFGEKTDWMKEDHDLSESSGISIDEDIYILRNGEVLKLFQGERQGFNLEEGSVKIEIVGIFTAINIENFYALDKNNGRIVKFSKSTGEIISQYRNEELFSAKDFSINEELGKAYFINSSGLKSFDL